MTTTTDLPRLVGQRDLAVELDVHPMAIWRALQKPGAPQPLAELRMGKIYDGDAVTAWWKARAAK